jgi:hypothetical protein
MNDETEAPPPVQIPNPSPKAIAAAVTVLEDPIGYTDAQVWGAAALLNYHAVMVAGANLHRAIMTLAQINGQDLAQRQAERQANDARAVIMKGLRNS